MGKKRIIAETGAGQHGVATATAAALFGLECVIYMGEEDTVRQSLNVARMKLLGATVVPVTTGTKTLKDAINEAMRDWVTNVESTHYLLGTVAGPHPFPTIGRNFHSIMGVEARQQILEKTGKLPTAVTACVGGGSNAIGLFHPFILDKDVQLHGYEAAGDGIETGRHAATLSGGTIGILHGTRSYVLQDENGQTLPSHSISAGLDYPGVGPEHAWLKDTGRAFYHPITGEAIVRQDLPLLTLPFTISHEIAHQLGYASETEANFIAFVLASNSKDPIFEYAMQLQLFTYSQEAQLFMIAKSGNFKKWEAVVKRNKALLTPKVLSDRKAIRAFFLSRQDQRIPGSEKLYDQFLIWNKQASGINSYNDVLLWALAYHKKQH